MVLKHGYYINRGLFIALYDEEEPLKIYLDNGVYGFLMSPAGSRHRNILADYACIRQRIKVFSFLKRKIICIGRIYGNKNSGSFYMNGYTIAQKQTRLPTNHHASRHTSPHRKSARQRARP